MTLGHILAPEIPDKGLAGDQLHQTGNTALSIFAKVERRGYQVLIVCKALPQNAFDHAATSCP